jgi:hypothetical protein
MADTSEKARIQARGWQQAMLPPLDPRPMDPSRPGRDSLAKRIRTWVLRRKELEC